MSEVVSDERVAAVLRPFVRACEPVLRALRESDPLRLRGRFGTSGADAETASEAGPGGGERLLRRLDAMRVPGSSTWDGMTVRQRCDWWSLRVGRFLAALVGLPRFGGAITSRLPLRNALGTVAQGLVLVAVAGEHGLHDRAEQVRMIAHVLFGRDLSRRAAAGESAEQRAADERRAAELAGGVDEPRRSRAGALGRAVWRMARALWEIHSELDSRPQGGVGYELIGSVPVVGVLGGYLGERSALRRITREAGKWIAAEHGLSTG
ncbi:MULTISPECIES: hypothetical protein [unclassified Actinopolyspora]|uniref:hypothetical protein n=1 Tax=unclassified Actinopolyspora TaxID=2639451 RepID=UPI0013F5A063|nr:MULTISPECIES: hypothetical protein [unclassified Actinopolyspora]NHD17921.1 hypothetical protein [Actinopolyspora sp. BKK2]NHE77794.1 hypothetical protein [Actinopolyspora sp. BKK1]